MLQISQLQAFLAEAQQAIPEITQSILVASEDRYTKFSREVNHQHQEVFLIALVPSGKVSNRSEDNVRFGNNLSFMIIRKMDTTSTEEEYVNTFAIAQAGILKLFDLIHSKTQNFETDCILKYFDLDTCTLVPVDNFHQTNGYDLSIRLKTNYVI